MSWCSLYKGFLEHLLVMSFIVLESTFVLFFFTLLANPRIWCLFEALPLRSIAPAPWPPDRVPEDMLPPVEVCNAFTLQEAQFDGRILVATDGSCQSCHSLKRAAWGIATENHVFAFPMKGCDQNIFALKRAAWGIATENHVFAFPMKGCDQNIFAAETWAVFQALHAAHVTGINVRILCDSQAVVIIAARVRRVGHYRPGPLAFGKLLLFSAVAALQMPNNNKLLAQPWPGMVARELTRYPVARLRMKNISQCDGVSGKGFAGAACKMSAYGTAWRRQKEEAG
eukprot:s3891_g3.t1